MARISLDNANRLIAHNRRRLVQLAGASDDANPLMQSVMRQLELSLKCVERNRDEMAAQRPTQRA